MFNLVPNGTYQIQKNGSLLSTVVASPSGVLALTEPMDQGDVLIFLPDGVQVQPPAPPQNVIATETNPGCITVSWLLGGEPDLAGYTVYYGTQSVDGGQATAYDDSVEVGLVASHEICSLASGTYYFAVKARNTSVMYSAYSYEATATIVPTDLEPPSVSILDPVENSLLVGTVAVDVNASDNVGVAGVRLQVDGIDVGVEDTQAPFQLSLSSPTVADGPHLLTAIARDVAGNTATSTQVSVFVDNDADPDHPAILLSASIGDLRARACFDAEGNPLAACTPTADWTALSSLLEPFVSSGSYSGMQGWHFALVYRVTKDPAYAMRAISIVEAEIADGFAEERASNYENVHEYLRDAAMVYDWAHAMLDAQQRTAIANYMNQLIHEIWDPSGNPYNVWSGADVDNPGSYRYYRFLLGTTLAAVATDGESASVPSLSWRGTNYSNLYSFVRARLDQEALPEWLETRGQGGGWHEGDYYGSLAKLAIMELYSVLKLDGRQDYLASSNFPTEAELYQFYSSEPGNQVRYGGGDSPADPMNTVGDLDRRLMHLFVASYGPQTEGQYAQYWLGVTPGMQASANVPWEFLLTRSNQPSLDYRQLPADYIAPGLGWINSRTSWQGDAISLTFVSGDHVQDHQHMDQNALVLFNHDWLAADAGTYSSSGTNGSTLLHNTLLVDGVGQRGGIGTGTLAKYEAMGDRTYVVGDASDAYHDGGGQSLLQSYNREVVHVKPDYIVVFDRVTPVDSNSTLTYLLHTKNQPSISGDEVQALNGSGKLFHRTLLPEGASIVPVAEQGGADGLNSWRVEVKPGSTSKTTNFLNVIYPTASTTSAMPVVTTVYSTDGNMVGAQIEAGAEDIVVMFSTDPLGAPPSGGIIYDVGMRGVPSVNTVTGLQPNSEYSVDVFPGMTFQTVIISRGPGRRTSDTGVLQFTIGDGTVAVSSLDIPISGGALSRR